jgi:cytochrome c
LRRDEFPLWKGDLLVLSLVGGAIHRLRLDGTRVVYDEPISFEGMRLRDVVELDNGRIAMLNDGGQIVLVRNADQAGGAPFLDASRQQRRTADMSMAERAYAVAGRYANGSAALGVDVATASEEDPAGRQVFLTHCSTCHSLSEGAAGVGPNLAGVVGREAGSTRFAYSDALANRGPKWTSKRIVEFAIGPALMYPGTVMPPVNLQTDQRAALERFFASFKQ